MTLHDLAKMAGTTLAPTKAGLPLIKLSAFGDQRSRGGSLRNNGNMLSVSGLEADYDGKRVGVEEAAALIRAAGLAAVIYTSPSHMHDFPRWRVLCPFSHALPPENRREMMGRLNAVLGAVPGGDILAGESFTASQAFYIGQPGDAFAPEVMTIPGQFIDVAELPDPVYPARGKSYPIALPPMAPGTPPDARARQALEAAKAAFRERGDKGRHQVLLDATDLVAPFVLSGHLDRDEAVDEIGAAMTDDGRAPNPNEVESALDGALSHAVPYADGTEFPELPPLPAPTPHKLFTSRDFRLDQHQAYVVKRLIAPGNVCALLGQPGAGKSTLAPYIAYAVAQGRPVFGLRTTAGRSLIVAAEDLTGTQKRLGALGLRYGHTDDCAVVESGNLRDPDNRARLAATVVEFRPALIVLDTVAAAFAGMEENGSQDMGEVVELARKLAATGAAVLLVHHPAKQGGDGSARGHGSLQGTLDMVLALAPDDVTDADTIVRGVTPKNRQGSTAWTLAFRKEVIELGVDSEGDATTTTLPVEVDESASEAARPVKLSPLETAAMTALTTRLDMSGADQLPEPEWLDLCAALSTAEKARDRLRSARNMHANLTEKGAICAVNGMILIPGAGSAGIKRGSTQGIEFVGGIKWDQNGIKTDQEPGNVGWMGSTPKGDPIPSHPTRSLEGVV
jgi:hypothetical protein